MIVKCLLLMAGLSVSSAGIQGLFPALGRVSYLLKGEVVTGTDAAASHWSVEGRISLTVYDNFTRVRLQLHDIETATLSHSIGFASHQTDAVEYLKQPWELDYKEDGVISAVYTGDEPAWSSNVKRGLSANFQLKTNTNGGYAEEACLYRTSCDVKYVVQGSTVRKYLSGADHYYKSYPDRWSSVPWMMGDQRYALETVTTAERVYELSARGLSSVTMNGAFRYRTNGHVLSVKTELVLQHESDHPPQPVEKLNLTKTSLEYQPGSYDDWTGGIRQTSQSELKNNTYEILLKIARKGIDADNIVRNPNLIHSLDFVDLLNTISLLSYKSLVKLFDGLLLGTSYDLETARNIFLEVLPHARSDDCVRLIRHLVVEERAKIEPATILSLIRKLPFNVDVKSQGLLEELETFSKLSMDFSQDIRHAGILTFAVLVSKVYGVKRDYFDNIVVKYFRMYSECPQYLDRMIWLQGLCNLGHSAASYTSTIYGDKTRDRHERLWATLACNWNYNGEEKLLTILLDEDEHIQLRIAALNEMLFSSYVDERLLSFVHSFICSSSSKELQRFWYTTVKSLEGSEHPRYTPYLKELIPFITKEVKNPDTTYWATNNYIASSGKQGPWVQLISVGDTPTPSLAAITVSSAGSLVYTASVYVIAEGVTSNIYKKMYNLKVDDVTSGKLLRLLEKMKMKLKTPEEVHIDLVVKIGKHTVYATHFNQTRFESYSGNDVLKSLTDFVRFGSHINQQVVYYPVQGYLHTPTELGTPIRLQTSVGMFTSIRGNLTSSPDDTQALAWENDMHIRYQGTTVTSLATAAPLLQSQYTARAQHSMVAHLPIQFNVTLQPLAKSIDWSLATAAPLLQSQYTARAQHSMVAHLPIQFNVTLQPLAKSIDLTWLNPFAQRAGVALHSRVQVETLSSSGKDTYTVSTGQENDVDDTGIFFDCKRKTTGAEVIEKYIMSKFMSYDILPIQQSVLSSIQKFFSSPGCGIIIPPTRPAQGDDEIIKVSFNLGNVIVFERVDRIEANFDFVLTYYSRNDQNKEEFLKIDSNTNIKCAGRNVTVESFLYVKQPYSLDPNKRFWKLCYFENDISHAHADQDIAVHPASYHGRAALRYRSSAARTSCSDQTNASAIVLDYRGTPNAVNGDVERYVEVKIKGEKLHQFDLLPALGIAGGTPVAQLLGSFEKDTIDTTTIIKEKNGIASISLNAGVAVQVDSDNYAWLLDSWTGMQLMKRFGFYRECRLHGATVQTLSGAVEQLPALQCAESLLLADCSETPSSSFVILRQQNGGIKLYEGYSNTTSTNHTNLDTADIGLPVVEIGDGVKFVSEASGIIVYKRPSETVILLPAFYTHSACGECVSQNAKTNC
ncbi:uncharacterized protein LOC112052947 [Bicyclus anynana]|uniref:Uncharacterized protein LOC112052947 n=1 Tax=Bicyclus anynana TaxID=110368 RepID=A0ABM3M335_BICAN|nr:uncharacterized protein LOC112052947 [Bicyclus anynana]